MRKQCRGFSIVEALAILSIVGILIVTALPAWKRSKTLSAVAETQQDFLEIQAALESFFADHQYYPEDHDNFPSHSMDGLFLLTTPTPYLSPAVTLLDPFSLDRPLGPIYYEGGGGCSPFSPIRPLPGYDSVMCVPAYLLVGIGPDIADSTSLNDSFPFDTQLRSYSPTNGIESFGDIYRMTGSYEQGDFFLDGVQIGGGARR